MISQYFLSLQEEQEEGNSLFIKQNLRMFGDTQSCICCFPTTVLSFSVSLRDTISSYFVYFEILLLGT